MQEGAFGPDIEGVEDPPHCVYSDTEPGWASVHDLTNKRCPTGWSNPRYTGGPGEDRFRGSDIVNGGNGSDICDAETESACERDFPPPPKIRLP